MTKNYSVTTFPTLFFKKYLPNMLYNHEYSHVLVANFPFSTGDKFMGHNASGINIKTLRKKLQLTQIDMLIACQLCGLKLYQSDISRIENSRRVVYDYELFVFAVILDTTPDELINFKSSQLPTGRNRRKW